MAEEKKGFFKRLKEGLSKTRNSIVDSFSSVFGASHIDDDFYEELEETFIMADMGYETTEKVIENLKERVKEARIKEPAACKELIINIIRDQMMVDESAYDFEKKKTIRNNINYARCMEKYFNENNMYSESNSILKEIIVEMISYYANYKEFDTIDISLRGR